MLIGYPIAVYLLLELGIFNYSSVTASGSKESNFLQIPSIANLLTSDPYETPDIEVSSLVSQDQPGFKFPSSVDKFKSQDAKLLTSDPYYGGISGADKIDDAGDKIDVYYKEGNIYYSDYYYDDLYDEGGEDYYLESGNTKEYQQPQDNLFPESVEDEFTKFESNPKAQVSKSSPQEDASDNPVYSQGPLAPTDIVYSVPYSKTKIMNTQSHVLDKIFDTSVSDRSQNSSNFEDIFMTQSGKQQNTTQPDQNNLVKIIEKKPNIMIEGHGEEKVMLVTPATISSSGEIAAEAPFDVLTDKLTLDDIHNFTYEGW